MDSREFGHTGVHVSPISVWLEVIAASVPRALLTACAPSERKVWPVVSALAGTRRPGCVPPRNALNWVLMFAGVSTRRETTRLGT